MRLWSPCTGALLVFALGDQRGYLLGLLGLEDQSLAQGRLCARAQRQLQLPFLRDVLGQRFIGVCLDRRRILRVFNRDVDRADDPARAKTRRKGSLRFLCTHTKLL